jgi:DNA-binding HxlR family transcriptional regulator
MRIFGRSSAFDNAFASLKEALPKKPQINSKALTQKLPSAFSTLTTLQNNKGNKARLGFGVSHRPMISINTRLKNTFGEGKLTNSIFQKSINVSEKERNAFQNRANDLLRRLDSLEGVVDRSLDAALSRLKNYSRGMRAGQQSEAEAIYNDIRKDIELTRKMVYQTLQENNFSGQHKVSLREVGLSKNQYNKAMNYFDMLDSEMQSKLQIAKNRLGDLT